MSKKVKKTEFLGYVNGEEFVNVNDYNEAVRKLVEKGEAFEAHTTSKTKFVEEEPCECACKHNKEPEQVSQETACKIIDTAVGVIMESVKARKESLQAKMDELSDLVDSIQNQLDETNDLLDDIWDELDRIDEPEEEKTLTESLAEECEKEPDGHDLMKTICDLLGFKPVFD